MNNLFPINSIYNSLMAYNIGKNLSDKTFQIGDQKFSTLGTYLSGLSALGSISSTNEFNNKKRIIDGLRLKANASDYINVPYQDSYDSSRQDMFNPSAFQIGGEVEPITEKSLDEFSFSAPTLYDYQKTKSHVQSLPEVDFSIFNKRADNIAKDYVTYQRQKKDNIIQSNEYEQLLNQLSDAYNRNDQEAATNIQEQINIMEAGIMPKLDCLGSSCMYTDRYFNKDYNLPGMGKIKERLLKYTNANDAGMAAWNIFGALKKDSPDQIDWSIPPQKEGKEKSTKYADLPQEVKDKIVIGSNIGFYNNASRKGINEQEGIQDTRHHAIVIGFDKDKTPILFDYGAARRIDNPTFNWNIGAIATPREYREANITPDQYLTNPIDYSSTTKRYYNKNSEDKDVNEVSKSLIDNKEKIKKDLNINEYDYNRLASYLLAIGNQESSNYNLASKTNDFFASAKSNPSLGIFQIKLQNAKELVKRYNLPEEYATKAALKDPYKSAVIGMYLAADIDKTKEGMYKQGLQPQQNVKASKPYINIPLFNKIRRNTTINTQGNSDLSENEKFFYAWNSPNKLKTGQAQGESEYVNNIKEYLQNVGIEFKKGGIYIKPENRGKFTASAKRAGMGVQEFASHVLANKDDYTPLQVKRANFAKNFGKEDGGLITMEGGGIPDRYKKMGFSRVGQEKRSNRPGKKWRVLAKKGNKYKVVHGGYKGMQDYTQHGDSERKKRFWQRMGTTNDKFSPRYWHKKLGKWDEGGEVNENLVDKLGYKNNSPFLQSPELKINSNIITTEDMAFPIKAVSNTGDAKILYPNTGEFRFDGDYVIEQPLEDEFTEYLKKGGYLKDSNTYVTKDGRETRRGLWANVYLKKKRMDEGGFYDIYDDIDEDEIEEPVEEYEDWQMGGKEEAPKFNSLEDYIRENPDDYEAILMMGAMYQDIPQVLEDDFMRQDTPKRTHIQFEDDDDEEETIFPVVEQLKSMGLNPSSVNTGKHNVGSKHYHNKAVDIGLNTTFGGDTRKMQEFLEVHYPRLKQQFPNLKLIDERNRPAGQKVWSGSHYHLEF